MMVSPRWVATLAAKTGVGHALFRIAPVEHALVAHPEVLNRHASSAPRPPGSIFPGHSPRLAGSIAGDVGPTADPGADVLGCDVRVGGDDLDVVHADGEFLGNDLGDDRLRPWPTSIAPVRTPADPSSFILTMTPEPLG